LRSTKYKNIFGLGDICNTPTTKTFFSAYYQVHHLRENLNASMEGKPMEYGYDGSSKALV